MKIKILGTRGEIKQSAPYHRLKSGVLLDDLIMLDIGDKSFLDYHPEAILITHLHPDHAYFVRHHELPQTTAKLYAPETYDTLPIQVALKPFTIRDYTITPIPTIHSIKVKSQAYLIEHKHKKLLYTGDMIWIDKQYHHLLQKSDLIITEASFARTGGMIRRKNDQLYGHTGIPNLIHVFKNFTQTVLVMHFGGWFYEDIKKARHYFAELGKGNNITIIVGYDGLEIEI